MIRIRSEVFVEDVTGRDIGEFMVKCTDEKYQQWWPGVHLQFHTTKGVPGSIGSRVCFDEYVGTRRLKLKGVLRRYEPGREITWQIIKFIKLPSWLRMRMIDSDEGVLIIHDLLTGFKSAGRIFDPLFRVFLSKKFLAELDEHAQTEFPMLGKILHDEKESAR